MLVVVHSFREPEMLSIESCGQFPIGDRQCDVVQRHPSIIAGTRSDRWHNRTRARPDVRLTAAPLGRRSREVPIQAFAHDCIGTQAAILSEPNVSASFPAREERICVVLEALQIGWLDVARIVAFE